MISILLYRCFLALYGLTARLLALWNPKARAWVRGRKGIWDKLASALEKRGKRPLIWMHCASLGEFEQGRPVLEGLKAEHPGCFILLSFFSPSGYEAQKHFTGADHICYLPEDGPANARRFLNRVQPQLALFVKYEFWHYYLAELKRRQTPLLLVSGIFRPGQPFFQWYGTLHRRMLSAFQWFFVQNRESVSLLGQLGYAGQTTLSGDTRFDRVAAIAEAAVEVPEIAAFAAGQPLLVAGSTWPEDERLLARLMENQPGLKLILAPHEVNEPHLKAIEQLFSGPCRLSTFKNGQEYRVLVIDNIGMLSRLYCYGRVAYIGGGWGKDGVHNVLEAAVYGIPLLHGPVYNKFAEAVDLVKEGGSRAVENEAALARAVEIFFGEEGGEYEKAAAAAKAYVYGKVGATAIILAYIRKNVALPW